MDFSTQVVPAIIILIANLLSGKHESNRWENVTAAFGWIGGTSLLAYLLLAIFTPEMPIKNYLSQIAGFSILTALSRDYEKLLKPLFSRNR